MADIRSFTLTVEVWTIDGETPTIEETVARLENDLDISLETDRGVVEVVAISAEFLKSRRAPDPGQGATMNTQAVEARLNNYPGDNIWQDVIYDLLTAEEWGAALDDGGSDDRFVHSGVEYRYDLSTARWEAV